MEKEEQRKVAPGTQARRSLEIAAVMSRQITEWVRSEEQPQKEQESFEPNKMSENVTVESIDNSSVAPVMKEVMMKEVKEID